MRQKINDIIKDEEYWKNFTEKEINDFNKTLAECQESFYVDFVREALGKWMEWKEFREKNE